MKTIGFFNSKGGVGTTTLVYHIACMLNELGTKLIVADLDPQATLTSLFLSDDRLEERPEASLRSTLHGAVSPEFRRVGDLRPPVIEKISDQIGLLPGDLELSTLDDALFEAWFGCRDGDERSFRVMSAFARAIGIAGAAFGAEVALVDLGPNLGPLNRAALLACDFVIVPVAADLLSLRGLRIMGPALRRWRKDWQDWRPNSPDPALPPGEMEPAGYIVMRHSVTAGRPVRAYNRWIARIPALYREYVLDERDNTQDDASNDPNCLTQLQDYRSLMPMAREARKPMFLLRPADGAFGGHQQAVQSCYADFKALTLLIMQRIHTTDFQIPAPIC